MLRDITKEIIEAKVNDFGLSCYFKYEPKKAAYVLIHSFSDNTLTTSEINYYLNLHILNGFFYESEDGITISKLAADLLLDFNLDYFKIAENQNMATNNNFDVNNNNQLPTTILDAQAQLPEKSIIEKLKSREVDLRICLPIGGYTVSRIPLRFTYNQDLETLVYRSQDEKNIVNIYFSLTNYFVVNHKYSIFTFAKNIIQTENFDRVLSLLATHPHAFSLISNSNQNEQEENIDELIKKGELQITIDFEIKYKNHRKIIFTYDDKVHAYVFSNTEVLLPNETLGKLNERLYYNIFKSFPSNPLCVTRTSGLKIANIADIKLMLQCNYVSYTKNLKRQQMNNNNIQSNNNNNVSNLTSINSLLSKHVDLFKKHVITTYLSDNNNNNSETENKLEKLMIYFLSDKFI